MTTTTMPSQAWVYRARALRAVDGDTLDVELDQGLHTRRLERLRLLGVNAPEVHGPSRDAGLAATAWTRGWLDAAATGAPGVAWPLLLQTTRSDVFGRWLATCWRVGDGACLNDDILAAGMAVPFAP